jgi:5-methylcytosine-specific restriction enzyme subunit McrC
MSLMLKLVMMNSMVKKIKLAAQISILIPEWTTASPHSHPILAGFSFEDDPTARLVAQRLTDSRYIIFKELSSGLEIQTSSVVGSVHLGRLSLTIRPKLEDLPLMHLLRFAYGLRDLDIFDAQAFSSRHLAFQDLLILQLIIEIEELLARGLQRRYLYQEESLISPVGRVDFQKFASQGGLIDGKLPSMYYHRLENCLHNQVLLSGLLLASQLTTDLILRSRTRRLARLLAETIKPILLHNHVMKQIARESNRLTKAYNSAIKIVALLMGIAGTDINEKSDQVHLHGFLFDMNHFFQALLSKLLNNFLAGYEVKDEHNLKGFLAYVPGYELPSRHDPLPRPDFAVYETGQLISLLDAKYRDLWQEGLPREMLYQLIVYALSQQMDRTATILYPSMNKNAKEARIQINEPLHGIPTGQVIMRPVNLQALEKMITTKQTDELKILTHKLVFGK